MQDDLMLILGRMEGKLDALVESVAKHAEDDKEVHHDAETRLRSLERWRAYIVGLGAATGMAGTKLIALIGGH